MKNGKPVVDQRVVLFVVNVDWFFVSHRLRLAQAVQKAGFEVHVCAEDTGVRSHIEAQGFRFHRVNIDRGGANPARDLQTVVQLTKVYRQIRPWLVHHVTMKPVLYGSLAARFSRVPAVVNAVSGMGHVFTDRGRSTLKQLGARRLLAAGLGLVLDSANSRVILQNPEDRGQLVAQGLVSPERCVIIHGSGVNLDRFTPTPLPSGPPLVVMPARLLWDKGVGEFVSAAKSLRAILPDARFRLVGALDPHNPAAVRESTVLEWTKSQVIEWNGLVPAEEMPTIYREASLVVLPSYREGLPLTLAEASCSGRACVTTDVPGCRDAVVNGKTGWIVPARNAAALADAIAAALADRDELARRSQAAAHWGRLRFAESAVFEATFDVYRSLGGVS